MDENSKFTTSEIATLVVVGCAALYGTYQLGKLGVDWAREGIRTIKDKKNSAK